MSGMMLVGLKSPSARRRPPEARAPRWRAAAWRAGASARPLHDRPAAVAVTEDELHQALARREPRRPPAAPEAVAGLREARADHRRPERPRGCADPAVLGDHP